MTMRLSEATIKEAFDRHAESYGNERLWTIPYHVECWSQAHKAFDGRSDAAFNWLYDELKNKWQVFRSKNYDATPPDVVRKIIDTLPPSSHYRRLSELAEPTPTLLEELGVALTVAAPIKRNKDGPSLMAVTKFLHFWNPRLFVIADREVIWEWVFKHGWIWDQVERVRREIEPSFPAAVLGPKDFSTSLMQYIAVLTWGGRVLRDNPGVCSTFAAYVERCYGKPVNLNLREYEGAALEWLLLGLVEMPPAGVTIVI